METAMKFRRQIKSGEKSIRQVSRETGLSRNTISKYLKDPTSPRYSRTKPAKQRRLSEYEQLLISLYETDLSRPLRERRTMRGLYEALVLEGYSYFVIN